MKNYLCTLLLAICTYSTLYAYEEEIVEDRIYINSKDVWIADNGIFVNIDGYVMPVSSIYHDNEKIFINIKPKMAWICDCGLPHFPWVEECSRCGEKRHKDKN